MKIENKSNSIEVNLLFQNKMRSSTIQFIVCYSLTSNNYNFSGISIPIQNAMSMEKINLLDRSNTLLNLFVTDFNWN